MHLRYAISPGRLTSAVTGDLPRPGGSPDLGSNPRTLPDPASPSGQDALGALLAQAADLPATSIDFFLLREPNLAARQLATLSRDILRAFGYGSTRLLIHSRADIAVATRAHGVHLPSTSGTLEPAQVRTVYASAGLPPPVVSLSCHTPDDLARARTLHPDLILFGPIFGKQVHGIPIHLGAGLEALGQACDLATPIPVLALGGITEANTQSCLDAGAAGIAAIRLFSESPSARLK